MPEIIGGTLPPDEVRIAVEALRRGRHAVLVRRPEAQTRMESLASATKVALDLAIQEQATEYTSRNGDGQPRGGAVFALRNGTKNSPHRRVKQSGR